MVDPNRTINLPSSSKESAEEVLDQDQVALIKSLEEKFKDRFTENDEEYMKVLKRKNKDPPILELNFYQGHKRPYNNYNNRGGYNRGGYQNRGGYHNNRGGYNNYHKRPYNNYNQRNETEDFGGENVELLFRVKTFQVNLLFQVLQRDPDTTEPKLLGIHHKIAPFF